MAPLGTKLLAFDPASGAVRDRLKRRAARTSASNEAPAVHPAWGIFCAIRQLFKEIYGENEAITDGKMLRLKSFTRRTSVFRTRYSPWYGQYGIIRREPEPH